MEAIEADKLFIFFLKYLVAPVPRYTEFFRIEA